MTLSNNHKCSINSILLLLATLFFLIDKALTCLLLRFTCKAYNEKLASIEIHKTLTLTIVTFNQVPAGI